MSERIGQDANQLKAAANKKHPLPESDIEQQATLTNVVKKAARLLSCSRVLILLQDPQENKLLLLPSSFNTTSNDLEILQDPKVSSFLNQIFTGQLLSVDKIEPFEDLTFTLPLIYDVTNSAGIVTSSIPVGVMLGFGSKEIEEEDINILNLFSKQISQIIAAADFLPKIQKAVTNYRTAMTSFPIGVTFLDKEGVIFELNPSMQLLKIAETSKGSSYKDAFIKESAFLVPMIQEALINAKASKQSLTINVTDDSGVSSKTLQIQVQPTFGHTSTSAEVVGASIAVFDVSLNSQADEALTNSVMATISHDLRTPLTVISGYAQTLSDLLSEGELDKDLGTEFLGGIIVQAARMKRLVADLLDAERIASGHSLSLVKAPFNLIESVWDIIKAQQSFSDAASITLKSNIDNLEVHADKDRIEQVLANYLNNAVKYSPKGGLITVDVSIAEDLVCVSVKDQGIGIPPEQLEKLFGRLYRVESENHSGIKGTGLGLYLCKNLIMLHGGTVNVQSVYGEGSTFSFTLPLG